MAADEVVMATEVVVWAAAVMVVVEMVARVYDKRPDSPLTRVSSGMRTPSVAGECSSRGADCLSHPCHLVCNVLPGLP